MIKQKAIISAHDISEGGLFTTLLKSAMVRNLGFEIELNKDIRNDAFLFGEAQSRVVVTVKKDEVAAFEAVMKDHPYEQIGSVNSGSIMIEDEDWGNIKDWKKKYDTVLEKYMGK